jgi:hypothetical protein
VGGARPSDARPVPPPPIQDAAPPLDARLPDVGRRPDAGACNDLMQLGPLVVPTVTPMAPPAEMPAGGRIEDGTYVLTALRVGGPGSIVFLALRLQITIRISGGGTVAERLVSAALAGMTPPEQRDRQALSVSGTNLTTTPLCPTGGAVDVTPYTATENELRLFEPNPSAVLVLTRQ